MALNTEEASVTDIDEAMRHIQSMLAVPGIEKTRRNILLESLDDLLDARLEITHSEQTLLQFVPEAENGNKRSGVDNSQAIPE